MLSTPNSNSDRPRVVRYDGPILKSCHTEVRSSLCAPPRYIRLINDTCRYLHQFAPTELATDYILHWDADIGTDQNAEIVIYIENIAAETAWIFARGENVRGGRCEGRRCSVSLSTSPLRGLLLWISVPLRFSRHHFFAVYPRYRPMPNEVSAPAVSSWGVFIDRSS